MQAALVWILIACLPSGLARAQLPESGGYAAAPDAWLLGNGQTWHHRSGVAATPRPLPSREPTAAEAVVIESARRMLEQRPARAMALIDGDHVIWIGYKEPASAKTRFLSFSIGKTLTSVAVGRAHCAGKLPLDAKVGEFLPGLESTDLGAARVTDLLRMASGTWEGNPDSTVANRQQNDDLAQGRLSLYDLLLTPQVSSAQRDATGAKRTAGSEFAYRSTDPLALGIVLDRSTGVRYADWLEREVLLPAGIARPAVIGQDRFGYGQADGNVRLYFDDWIRFAIWVREREKERDCFGDYMREATHTRIANRSKRFGKLFDGYGYLVWTENKYRNDSYWAVGHGGQRIGWNHANRRVLVAFSNVESYMDELYRLYRDWATLGD